MKMLKGALGFLAALGVIMGGIWILQGLNILPGSFMTGDIQWAYRGGALALAGAAALFWVTRGRKRSGE